MKQIVIAVAMLISMASQTHAQKFWLTTPSFPNGSKTALTMAENNSLVVGTPKGIIRSTDSGTTWVQTLNDGFINTLYTAKNGFILAGSNGVIYLSEDRGLTWASINLNHPYPVRKFIENSEGRLFAITGELNNAGYEGAGVFTSIDAGLTWEQRNAGLASTLACFQIAIDKNDKLYVTMPDENGNGAGGLFTSTTHGNTWQHTSTVIDGKGAIAGRLYVTTPFSITVTPNDSVVFSFNGISRLPGQSGVGVDINLIKHINNIGSSSLWQTVYAKPIGSMWWNAAKLNQTYFAANGDMYSSISGSENTGGSIFRKDEHPYFFHDNGLGLDEWGRRGEQYFAETTNGKVFMVQWMDERVYYADTSTVPTGIETPTDLAFSLYPNPINGGSKINIYIEQANEPVEVSVYDAIGNELIKMKDITQITMPEQSGVYLLCIQSGAARQTRRVIVQ